VTKARPRTCSRSSHSRARPLSDRRWRTELTPRLPTAISPSWEGATGAPPPRPPTGAGPAIPPTGRAGSTDASSRSYPAMIFFISASAQAIASLVEVPVTAFAIMFGRMNELVMSWTLSLEGAGQP
jgi:hypothetical protein